VTPDISQESIGARLKRLRLERGLSQRELAAPGVSYAYISRIEAGTRQPSVKALRRLAAKLNVSPEYLETGSDIRDADARELRLLDAELALRLGDPAVAEQLLAEVLGEALTAGDTANAARARTALGLAAAERGDHPEAVKQLEAALDAERLSPVDRVDVYATLGRGYSAIGAPERAVDLFEECLAEVGDANVGDPGAAVRYATLLSCAFSDMGDLGRAESVLKEALEQAREHGADPYTRVRLYWSLARLAEMEGKSVAALHHARRAIALLEATDNTIHLGRAHILCACIMTTHGDPTASLKHLDEAEVLFGSSPAGEDAGTLKVERARAQALLGNGEAATHFAQEAIALIGDNDDAALGLANAALAEGLALGGELEAADEAFRLAVDLLESRWRWREATQACQSWGRMLRRAGRQQEALDVLDRASELSLRTTSISATAEL
jgi:transcriptional regulator with XRE-family HTH domain